MSRATDTTARLGIAICEHFFSDHDWLFREQPTHDWGIGAQIKPKKDGKPSGRLIALQIKSGSFFFEESELEHYRYRVHRAGKLLYQW